MHYDKNGNYISWWTKSSEYAFESKSRCLREQYSNYTIFGKNVSVQLPFERINSIMIAIYGEFCIIYTLSCDHAWSLGQFLN